VSSLQAMRVAFGEALADLGHRNPDVVALDADLATATRFSLFAEEFPERFFQVGVAEQNMAGVAAGLATVGFIPFIGSFACFVSCRIADQVRTSIAQPGLNVNIIGPYSGLLTGNTGKTHQAIEDIAIYRSIPNMAIVAPADGVETRLVVGAVAEYAGPVYVRLTRDPAPVIFDGTHTFEIGRAYRLREGNALTLISTGSMTPTALEAAAMLAQEGLEATVLHVPTIKPLDVNRIVEAARASGCVITVEEHNVYGGLGAAVAEALSEQLPVPVYRIGIRDVFAESGPNAPLLEKYGLTARHVVEAAHRWVTQWSGGGI
jgi:transketolase